MEILWSLPDGKPFRSHSERNSLMTLILQGTPSIPGMYFVGLSIVFALYLASLQDLPSSNLGSWLSIAQSLMKSCSWSWGKYGRILMGLLSGCVSVSHTAWELPSDSMAVRGSQDPHSLGIPNPCHAEWCRLEDSWALKSKLCHRVRKRERKPEGLRKALVVMRTMDNEWAPWKHWDSPEVKCGRGNEELGETGERF